MEMLAVVSQMLMCNLGYIIESATAIYRSPNAKVQLSDLARSPSNVSADTIFVIFTVNILDG
jgi:hypothetical protein